MINQAVHLLHVGDARSARLAAEEALELMRKSGHRSGVGMATVALAGAYLDEEVYAAALDLALSAQATFRRNDALVYRGGADTLVGFAELGLGRPDRAISEFEDAADAKNRTGGSDGWAQAALVLARLACGDREGALATIPKVGEAYREIVVALVSGEPIPEIPPGVIRAVDYRWVVRFARDLRHRAG